MDKLLANQMATELKGVAFDGWEIEEFIGAGKSAVVLKARKANELAAVKVFDRNLVERYGADKQLLRIQRELSLMGVVHPHLIEILGGGRHDATNTLFVVMKYLPHRNLAEERDNIPRSSIWKIVSQLADAAQLLESKGLAHRDIKPENIAISPTFETATLLDLGVLRPFGDGSLTDEQAPDFIGTLRYSAPEHLFRTEQDDELGWRAVTFYQLGAVLHDLIMKRELFDEFSNPYSVLTQAVKTEIPLIEADDLPADLVLLAKNCLVKDPKVRQAVVTWSDFTPHLEGHVREDARTRVTKRLLAAQSTREADTELEPWQRQDLLRRLGDQLEAITRLECLQAKVFPPLHLKQALSNTASIVVHFDADARFGLEGPLCLVIEGILLDSSSEAVEIRANALFGADVETALQQATTRVVYRGVLDPCAVKEAISTLLYVMLDEAQSQHPVDPQHGWRQLSLDGAILKGHI